MTWSRVGLAASGLFLVGVALCSCSSSSDTTKVEDTLSVDTSKTAKFTQEATTVYTNAYEAIAAKWPISDEAHFKAMTELGLKQELKYYWVSRADSAGTTSVNGGPQSWIWVRYEPNGAQVLAPEVLAALRATAKSVRFYPPDALSYTTEDVVRQTKIETTVEVRLPLGLWICTSSRLQQPTSQP